MATRVRRSLWMCTTVFLLLGTNSSNPFAQVHNVRRTERRLEDSGSNTCSCGGNEEEDLTTIRLLAPGGADGFFDFIADRFQRRVDKFYEKSGIQVEILRQGTFGQLVDEIFANAGNGVYDGYAFEPAIVGGKAGQSATGMLWNPIDYLLCFNT